MERRLNNVDSTHLLVVQSGRASPDTTNRTLDSSSHLLKPLEYEPQFSNLFKLVKDANFRFSADSDLLILLDVQFQNYVLETLRHLR